jgi:hypothetical protein
VGAARLADGGAGAVSLTAALKSRCSMQFLDAVDDVLYAPLREIRFAGWHYAN